MERFAPFAAAGCAAFVSCALACAFGTIAAVLLAALFIAAILFLILSKPFPSRRIWFFILIAATLVLIRYIMSYYINFQTISQYTGETRSLECQITDILPQNNGVRYTVSIPSATGSHRLKAYLWASSDMAAGQIGETFTGEAAFYPRPDSRWEESSLYGSRIHLKGKIIIGGFTQSERLFPESVSSKFRQKTARMISNVLPDQRGALLCAVLTGDRSRLSNASLQILRRAGLSHILALSGLHLSVLSGLFSHLPIWKTRKSKKWLALLGISIILAYCFFTGASNSILRAAGMWILIYISQILERPYHNINALGASVLILTLINPFSAASISMWYSAGSTLAILWFSPKMSESAHHLIRQKPYKKILFSILTPVFASISALTAVIPISWAAGYTISLASPISSLAASLLLPLILGFGLLGCLPVPILSEVFLHISGLFSGLLNLVVLWISKIPFSVVPKGMTWIIPCLAGTFVIGALCLHDGRKGTLLSGTFWIVILFSVSSLSYTICMKNITRIIIPAETNCAVVSRNHTHFLIGEITSIREAECLASVLEDYHIRHLELAVLNNRVGGELEPLSNQAEISVLAAPSQPGSKEFLRYAGQFIPLEKMSFSFGEDISISIVPFDSGYTLSMQADGVSLLQFLESSAIIDLDIYPKHQIVFLPLVQAKGIHLLPSDYNIVTASTDSYNIYHAPRSAEMVYASEKNAVFTIKNGSVALQK